LSFDPAILTTEHQVRLHMLAEMMEREKCTAAAIDLALRADDLCIRNMAGEGVSYEAIADAIGRSSSYVRSRAKKLGLAPRKPGPATKSISPTSLTGNSLIVWRVMSEIANEGLEQTYVSIAARSSVARGSLNYCFARLFATGTIDSPYPPCKILKKYPNALPMPQRAVAESPFSTKASPAKSPSKIDAVLPPKPIAPDPLQHVIDWLAAHQIEVKIVGGRYRVNGRVSTTPEELIEIANRKRRGLGMAPFSLDARAA